MLEYLPEDPEQCFLDLALVVLQRMQTFDGFVPGAP
jgi:hypothetical protein